jgi:Uma2 family endonuclease
MPLAQKNVLYTYADFLEWNEEERYEIIDGLALMMSPPVTSHQRVCRNLFAQILDFLKGKPGEAFFAPFSVRLDPAPDFSDTTVLEPDIVVVLDPSKIDSRGCNGAPDLVIEVLSPSTARHDRIIKYQKYLAAGVREYWLADPDTKSVQACVLENGRYILTMYDEAARAPVGVLPGCDINLAAVFGY